MRAWGFWMQECQREHIWYKETLSTFFSNEELHASGTIQRCEMLGKLSHTPPYVITAQYFGPWAIFLNTTQKENPDSLKRYISQGQHEPKKTCLFCYLVAKACPTLYDPMDYSLPGFSVHGIIQASTQVGCHFLPQGIFLTQGSNPHLLHWQADSSLLSRQGSPKTHNLWGWLGTPLVYLWLQRLSWQ